MAQAHGVTARVEEGAVDRIISLVEVQEGGKAGRAAGVQEGWAKLEQRDVVSDVASLCHSAPGVSCAQVTV
jgi:hypothetical protein